MAEDMRTTGNRRSEEEIQVIKFDLNKETYKLDEQEDFKGTEDQLKMMQVGEFGYLDGQPIMSDEEWDHYKKLFNYKETMYAGSPSGRKWVKMQSPLPSIDKATNILELQDFLNRFEDGTEFYTEVKLDGLTDNSIYKLDEESGEYKFQTITSRGNGRYGLEVNKYALSGVKIKGVPKTIKKEVVQNLFKSKGIEETPEIFEIRGEAVIPKTEYTTKKYVGENGPEGITWRSVVSGILSRKVPSNIEGLIEYYYGISFEDFLAGLGLEEKYEYKGNWSHQLGESDWDLVLHLRSMYEEKNAIQKPSEDLLKRRVSKNAIEATLFSTPEGYYVELKYTDGESYSFNVLEEEVHFVSFSCSIGDSNIDTIELAEIPEILHVSNVNLTNNSDKFKDNYFIQTSKKEAIIDMVLDFYGCVRADNEVGYVRDKKKPRLRNMFLYACDGIVIKPVNSNRKTQEMYYRPSKNNPNKIVGPNYPSDQIACKLLSELVHVKLDRIDENKTDLNNVTCQGVLDKPYVTESGASVGVVNLHNREWLAVNDWIKPGMEYDMCMSMDIIPVLLNPNLTK